MESQEGQRQHTDIPTPPNQEREGGLEKAGTTLTPCAHPPPHPNPTQGDSIIVASEQGAVAALSASAPDGRIRWRHVLPTAAVDLVVDEGAGLVLALSRCVVSCFMHAGLVMDGQSPPLAFSKAPRTPHPLLKLANLHKHTTHIGSPPPLTMARARGEASSTAGRGAWATGRCCGTRRWPRAWE